MLQTIAGVCVRLLFCLIKSPCPSQIFTQNQLAKCGDPAIYTEHHISEPVFIVRQEYNDLNNSDGNVSDPPGFKEVREYCKKVQIIRDTADAQKQGAAEVAAALAAVKPKVRPSVSLFVYFQ